MRHIIAVSGGRDSSALALYLITDKALGDLPYEMVFTDTGVELPELYAYLDRLEAVLKQPILRLPGPRYEELLEHFGGVLPAPWARWCTDRLKVRPFNRWIGTAEATLYIAIRADEAERADTRYTRRKATVKRYPFIEGDIDQEGVRDILIRHGMWDHPMYAIKPRSGCWCCFFQSAASWRKIRQKYPDLFAKAKAWEQRELTNADGSPNVFTFSSRFRLADLEAQGELPFEDLDSFEAACTDCRDD